MLEKYRDDERVMHISGDNWLFGHQSSPSSYLFSRYCLSWGWATWRRSFRLSAGTSRRGRRFVVGLGSTTCWAIRGPLSIGRRSSTVSIPELARGTFWDYQWLFSIWLHHGLSILPDRNLVSNLGFNREDAVHTKGGANDPLNGLPAVPMTFPLRHPDYMVRDVDADRLMFDKVVCPRQELGAYAEDASQMCGGAAGADPAVALDAEEVQIVVEGKIWRRQPHPPHDRQRQPRRFALPGAIVATLYAIGLWPGGRRATDPIRPLPLTVAADHAAERPLIFPSMSRPVVKPPRDLQPFEEAPAGAGSSTSEEPSEAAPQLSPLAPDDLVFHWRSIWRRALPDYLLSVATAVSDHAPAASMRWTEGASRSIYQTVPVNENPKHSRAARHQLDARATGRGESVNACCYAFSVAPSGMTPCST